ncbi:hypothetical protein BJ912DRAFT_955374, partial [Pholiota molesta]
MLPFHPLSLALAYLYVGSRSSAPFSSIASTAHPIHRRRSTLVITPGLPCAPPICDHPVWHATDPTFRRCMDQYDGAL